MPLGIFTPHIIHIYQGATLNQQSRDFMMPVSCRYMQRPLASGVGKLHVRSTI